jgi:hypothetical protein
MDTTTLLIIIIIVLIVFGGGWYGPGTLVLGLISAATRSRRVLAPRWHGV